MSKRNPNEKDVKRKGRELFTAHRWLYWMPPANGFGQSGIADAHALRDGVFVAPEYKHKTKLSALQKNFLRQVHLNGGIPMVVDDERLAHLAVWLSAFDHATAASMRGEKINPSHGAIMTNALLQLQREILDISEFETEMRVAAADNVGNPAPPDGEED